MRIKGDIITPSKRIVHDLQWLVERETRYAVEAHNTDLYLFVHAETFMARINSYLGLLKWTSSYRLRKKTLDNVKNSVWGKIYDVDSDYSKISIKPQHTKKAYYLEKNKKRKRLLAIDMRTYFSQA